MVQPEGGELPKPFGAQNIMSESQMQDVELQDLIYTLWSLVFIWLVCKHVLVLPS